MDFRIVLVGKDAGDLWLSPCDHKLSKLLRGLELRSKYTYHMKQVSQDRAFFLIFRD